jgi:hypothetical protein
LHPQFSNNGYFSLLYTVDRHHLLNYGTSRYSSSTNDYLKATIGRVTRFTATKMTTGFTVNKASRKVLIGASRYSGIPATHQSHGNGSLVFGSDGTLLVSAEMELVIYRRIAVTLPRHTINKLWPMV